jgi:hypothetical protein
MHERLIAHKMQAGSLARTIMEGRHNMDDSIDVPLDDNDTSAEEDNTTARSKTTPAWTVKDKYIGIWKKEQTDNDIPLYVRDKAFQQEWHFWAGVPSFPAVSSGKRVVLTGESVARGYLYDPHFNPAKALSALITDNTAFPDTEVIDLARNGMDLPMLSAVCQSALRLNPQLLIVFAGNNWLTSVLNASYTADELNALQQPFSTAQLESFVNTKLEEAITDFMKNLAAQAAAQHVPVMMVVPEYNLLSWRSSELERRMGRLSPEAATRWLQAVAAVQAAMDNGHILQATIHGEELIALDATNPLGYEILAQCRLHTGDLEAARTLLQQARDMAVYGRANSCGRNLAINRRLVLELAPQLGITVVDLPTVFQEHLQGALPGHHLFLDYCHMTDEGISIAMEQVMKGMAGIWGLPVVKNPVLPRADKDVQAMAHILAAIHNAHNGQDAAIVQYHCLSAVQTSAAVHRFMALYASLATRRLSNIICKYFEQILAGGFAEQYGQGRMLLHPENEKIMDVNLVEAIVMSLEKAGVRIQDSVQALRMKEHQVNDRPVNLLQSMYYRQSYQDHIGEVKHRYHATQQQSHFYLVAGSPLSVMLTICCRVPHHKCEGNLVTLLVNGIAVGQFPCTFNWATHEVTLASGILQPGLNIVSINWPVTFDGPTTHVHTKHPMEEMYAALYPVFGEIHMFNACRISPEPVFFS